MSTDCTAGTIVRPESRTESFRKPNWSLLVKAWSIIRDQIGASPYFRLLASSTIWRVIACFAPLLVDQGSSGTYRSSTASNVIMPFSMSRPRNYRTNLLAHPGHAANGTPCAEAAGHFRLTSGVRLFSIGHETLRLVRRFLNNASTRI
ncbi:hypothetical protein BDV96DRAFT_380474 [Lophiotrema nucula]|uniref:Uncharacterized protein n=1 Tax=Lophiotrema nucula TaxID=690887 RepID=A0A6A5ZG68_9PLEO|nr:hypothetical protein BDV96DRAFT_380474 [Lophiotrema nucula]